MHGCTLHRRAAGGRATLIAVTALAGSAMDRPATATPSVEAFEKIVFRGSDRLGPSDHREEQAFPDGTRVRLEARGTARVPTTHSILVTLPDGTRLGPVSLPRVNVLWHPVVWRGDVDGDGEDEFLHACTGIANGRGLQGTITPEVTVLDPRGGGPDRSLLAIDSRVAELPEVVTAMRARRAAAPTSETEPDLAAPFADAGVRGSVIILPALADAVLGAWEHDPAANDRRSSPASTSKIPHALAALQLGAITGMQEQFAWDGVPRAVAAWNRDLTVAEAIEVSAVWVFRAIARRIDADDYRGMFIAYGCGSARAHDDGLFWLDGTLAISPREQVVMLRRLHGRDPWVGIDTRRPDELRRIAAALPAVTGEGWTLRYKTGRAQDGPVDQGWCIGWVEREGREPVYFAARMDLPEAADAAKRLPLTLTCLRAVGIIPVARRRSSD